MIFGVPNCPIHVFLVAALLYTYTRGELIKIAAVAVNLMSAFRTVVPKLNAAPSLRQTKTIALSVSAARTTDFVGLAVIIALETPSILVNQVSAIAVLLPRNHPARDGQPLN